MNELSGINLQTFYPDCLKITKMEETSKTITLHMKSKKHSHRCVRCGLEMYVYHATYERTVQDLPILNKNVLLKITAYDYFCANGSCRVKTFAESFGDFIGRSGRMTDRLENFIRLLACIADIGAKDAVLLSWKSSTALHGIAG